MLRYEKENAFYIYYPIYRDNAFLLLQKGNILR